MPNPFERKKEGNPLYQNTEVPVAEESLAPIQQSEPEPAIKRRTRTSKRFDEKYDQFSSYIDNRYQEPFTELLDALGNTNKTDLFNEAVYDLFCKYQEMLHENGVEVERLPKYPSRPRL